jgi:outer membrane protein
MNKGLLALNGILLIAVGYLLYMQLSSKNSSPAKLHNFSAPSTVDSSRQIPIAYFEMDSIEKNFDIVKEVRTELNKKQEDMNAELDKLGKIYQDKANEYQGKAASMTQAQSEAASQDLMKLQEQYRTRKQTLEQEYNEIVTRRMSDVKSKIEIFLKDYNKNKRYSYIMIYEPGLFYYKDTAFNITADVVKGLNEMYRKKN